MSEYQNGEIQDTENRNIAVPERIWGPWATIGFGATVMTMSVIVQALVVIVFLAFAAFSRIETLTDPWQLMDLMLDSIGLLVAVATIVSGIICIGLVFIIIKAKHGVDIGEYLGLGPFRQKTILAAIAIVIGYMALSVGFNIFVERPTPDFMIDVYSTSVWPPLLWIGIVIFAPLFEEILFRGFLFVGLLPSRIGPTGTIFVTSLVWALLHVQYGIADMAEIFFLGIILGLVRLKTGSLWGPLVMHTLNNLVAMVLLAYGIQ